MPVVWPPVVVPVVVEEPVVGLDGFPRVVVERVVVRDAMRVASSAVVGEGEVAGAPGVVAGVPSAVVVWVGKAVESRRSQLRPVKGWDSSRNKVLVLMRMLTVWSG